MVHSFLLFGQSNAAGRGFLTEVPPIDTCEGRLKVLRNGRWLKMYRPVNPDRVTSGVCLAESFAKAYAQSHPDVEVGIIPCADGGTRISQWMPGELLYDNAIHCAKLAMRTSHLVGALWHQGESDCSEDKVVCYAEKLETVMSAVRKDLGLPSLPILMGGLGDFLPQFKESMKNYCRINAQTQAVAQKLSNCDFVSAEGLSSNPDHLHFSAAALEEFGRRYYEKYETLDLSNLITDKALLDDTKRSALEAL